MSRDAYDSAPLRGTELAWTRVYRKGGRYAHLRREDGSVTIACDSPAYPKMPAAREDCWLGTGSQAEYEKAASLPLHPACFAVREAAHGSEGHDPSDPAERAGTGGVT